jgi:hypothetical protein
MNMKRMNLGACALVLAALGSGCATTERVGTAQTQRPPTGDQTDVSETGAPAPATPTGSAAARPQHLSGMDVPNWWKTGALQSGDVMGVR